MGSLSHRNATHRRMVNKQLKKAKQERQAAKRERPDQAVSGTINQSKPSAPESLKGYPMTSKQDKALKAQLNNKPFRAQPYCLTHREIHAKGGANSGSIRAEEACLWCYSESDVLRERADNEKKYEQLESKTVALCGMPEDDWCILCHYPRCAVCGHIEDVHRFRGKCEECLHPFIDKNKFCERFK